MLWSYRCITSVGLPIPTRFFARRHTAREAHAGISCPQSNREDIDPTKTMGQSYVLNAARCFSLYMDQFSMPVANDREKETLGFQTRRTCWRRSSRSF